MDSLNKTIAAEGYPGDFVSTPPRASARDGFPDSHVINPLSL